MKPIAKSQETNETRYFEVVKTGEKLYGMICRWDAKIDVENKSFISICEDEYTASNLPTINDLISKGILRIIDEVESLTIDTQVDVRNLDAVIAYAGEHGYNIEREALIHNITAWESGRKSGYRGTECHVFTASGDNSLSFTLSKLNDRADWQTTYCS